jgi:hypothetical protein
VALDNATRAIANEKPEGREKAIREWADLASVAKVILTAEDKTGPAFQAVGKAIDGVNESKAIGLVTGGLAALGAALSIGTFSSMLQGTIEAQAHLQDLADKVGTTVNSLSQLTPAAKLSGTAMDDVAAISAKFSKSLAEVVQGNEKATAAFKAFGFSAEDAAKYLDDPSRGCRSSRSTSATSPRTAIAPRR